MKKIIPLIYILAFIIMVIFTIIASETYAGRGCCSWHGGQSYCDTNTGKWVCNDGTYSPSCRCSSYDSGTDLTDGSNNNTSNKYSTSDKKIEELEEENEKLKKENDNLNDWLTFIIFIIIGYIIYKVIKNNTNTKH